MGVAAAHEAAADEADAETLSLASHDQGRSRCPEASLSGLLSTSAMAKEFQTPMTTSAPSIT